jgi:hypothetical protein
MSSIIALCRTFGTRLDKFLIHALTGVAIECQPFGPVD